jgi:hypothetical protein
LVARDCEEGKDREAPEHRGFSGWALGEREL